MQPRYILTERALNDFNTNPTALWRKTIGVYKRVDMVLVKQKCETNRYIFENPEVLKFFNMVPESFGYLLPASALEIINKEEYLASTIF